MEDGGNNRDDSKEGENTKGHGDLGAAISAARKYASLMAEIETELEGQVIELEGQVTGLEGQVSTLETRNANLFQSYEVLKKRLQDAKKNCYDPDSPEAMAGDVQTITVKNHGISGGNQHNDQLARTIGDRIKIIETQTGHTGEYFIIGERHKLNDSMTRYETTWYLESATEGHWFMIDEDDIVTPDGNGQVPEDSAVLLPI